jgi:Flp pilus assembly pilin Flp
MTAVELAVLAGTIIGAVAAIIGVQVRLIAAVTERLTALDKRIDRLDEWHHAWRPLPPDMSSGPLLDRRLTRIEHRLDQIEHHLGHHPPKEEEHP